MMHGQQNVICKTDVTLTTGEFHISLKYMETFDEAVVGYFGNHYWNIFSVFFCRLQSVDNCLFSLSDS
jgi:hypothetical protein